MDEDCDDGNNVSGDGCTDLCVMEDRDGDGIGDFQEVNTGTDPLSADTDGDGLDDIDEVANGTDPRSPDTDSDGLLDGPEVLVHFTDPNDQDYFGIGV